MYGMLRRFCVLAWFASFGLIASSNALAVEATYRVTFENLWNPIDHSRNYPSNAHFSPLVGASHNSDISFWSPGSLATPGVEQVAETGATNLFLGEVNSAINSGDALQSVLGNNIFQGQSLSRDFDVSSEYPLVTFLSMIAPSPDWFVGIHDYDLREGNGFAEVRVFEFNSFYDSGTEDGTGFSISNPATNPVVDIFAVTGDDARNVFVNTIPVTPGPRGGQGPSDTELAPIARLTLSRLSQTVPEPGSLALTAMGLMGLLGIRRKFWQR